MDAQEVVVRRASRSDADLLLSAADLFSAPPTAEWTQDFLDNGSNLLLLALLDEVPVGMLVAVETGYLGASPDLFVYGIRVREHLRHQGIAHQLVDKAVAIAEEAGCRRVWGSVHHTQELLPDSPLSPPETTTTGSTTFTIPIP
ncbi:GNAT family N-acetyltransferase [Rhodococcus sp. IEGM 1408]|uniref:GNAT family N-acetyltransferase n=1 Tax=Rhodococcus sp. IEGM 1408 TaxID=3082220 RepID=UPI0029552515|nr:GNAT family N-acetyltransferase [Rhodococcus sp. IEGM 1408]MDV8003079.1 GNAT family N-acetyltransferase [Rhodococcus sp. IEGM 1408]